jgi:SWI/SNF-related matrix-associated actin-dependent regulator of chromatin subfamily A-like protein 1
MIFLIFNNKPLILITNLFRSLFSYDLTTKYKEKFDKLSFKTIIADEAHYLKNLSAKRTECLIPLLQRAKHPILLSGTPAFARPKELYSLLSALKPHVFTRFEDYGKRYCDPKPNKYTRGLDYDGVTNSDELHYLLTKTMMIRRLKKDVLTELPEKRRQKVTIEVNSKLAAEIKDNLKKIKNIDSFLTVLGENWEHKKTNAVEPDTMVSDNGDSFKLLNDCYLLTGLAKLEGIIDFLEGVLENDTKFLVFAHHIDVLDAIENKISKEGVRSIRIDGQVNYDERHIRVKEFQNNPTVRCAILSIMAAGVGLTLTAATTVIFAEVLLKFVKYFGLIRRHSGGFGL